MSFKSQEAMSMVFTIILVFSVTIFQTIKNKIKSAYNSLDIVYVVAKQYSIDLYLYRIR